MAIFDEAIFDPVIFDTGSAAPPAPTPDPTQDSGSPWGPWQPIRVRPLIRGSVTHRLRPLVATVTGTVLDNEDWLLGIPTDT